MKLHGRIKREKIAKGSKSERDALVLDTGSEQVVLRRVGGHPFADPELDRLVGKSATFEGERRGQYFFFSRAHADDEAA